MSWTSFDQSILSGHSGRMLVVVALGSLGSMLGRLVLPPLLPAIINDLGITSAIAGATLSLMWVMNAVFQFPGGHISDYTSRRTILTTSLILMAFGGSIIGFSVTFEMFLFGGVLVGIGVGLYFPPANAYLSELFKARRGQAFGVNTAAINLGGVVAGGLAVLALQTADWRTVFIPVVGYLIMVILLLNYWSIEQNTTEPIPFDIHGTLIRTFRHRKINRITFAAGSIGFAWQGIVNFLPTFLQLERGFSPTEASNVFILIFIVGVVVTPVAGRFSDRYAPPWVAAVLVSLGGIGLIVLVFGGSLVVTTLGVILFGAGLSGFWPVIGSFLMGQFSESNLGGDAGAVRTVYLTIGSLGPLFVGMIAAALNYTVAFTSLVIFFAIAIFLLMQLALRD